MTGEEDTMPVKNASLVLQWGASILQIQETDIIIL